MGKGSGRRPLLISEQEAEDNWNRIFGKNKDPIEKPFPHNILRNDYEYELNKSSGEIEKRFLDGINKPNEEQFNGRQESNTINTSETTEGTVPISSDSGEME